MKYKVTNNVEMLNEEFNLEAYNMTNDDYVNDREVLFLRFPQQGCEFVGILETGDPQKESAGWHLSASHHPHSDTRFPVF